MASSLGQALILLINTVGGIFLLAVLLRFLLQATGADFYNPVSQAIVKLTSSSLRPLRRIIPGFRGLDFAALVLALLVNTLASALMVFAAGFALPDLGTLISWAFVGILAFILNIYFYGLLISIIASWIAPYSGNPILMLVQQLMEPLQSLFRRVIPPMGGLDFSPIFIFLGIQMLEIIFIANFVRGLRLPAQLVIGV
ncbi:MAG: YggT family protein [Pseudomonadales bacterium]|nr:YggT family protein [Pseudomonadales bacterium]